MPLPCPPIQFPVVHCHGLSRLIGPVRSGEGAGLSLSSIAPLYFCFALLRNTKKRVTANTAVEPRATPRASGPRLLGQSEDRFPVGPGGSIGARLLSESDGLSRPGSSFGNGGLSRPGPIGVGPCGIGGPVETMGPMAVAWRRKFLLVCPETHSSLRMISLAFTPATRKEMDSPAGLARRISYSPCSLLRVDPNFSFTVLSKATISVFASGVWPFITAMPITFIRGSL